MKTSHLLPSLFALCLAACAGSPAAVPGTSRIPKDGDIGALGRLEPGRGVISVGALQGERVSRLLVAEGDEVQKEGVLAHLESYELRRAERDIAQARVGEAGSRLKAEEEFAGARIHEAETSVTLYQTELKQAERDLARLRELRRADTVSDQNLEEKQLFVRNTELALERSRAQRTTAEAELARARSAVGLAGLRAELGAAEARLALTVVRAPIRGRVLKVFTYPGETVGPRPILDLGDTSNMYAVAEVYETDLARVKKGDAATITSDALGGGPNPLTGKVEEIGWMIHKNDVINIDPREDTDTRVVEVRIKLDDPQRALNLTHHEVRIRIRPSGAN